MLHRCTSHSRSSSPRSATVKALSTESDESLGIALPSPSLLPRKKTHGIHDFAVVGTALVAAGRALTTEPSGNVKDVHSDIGLKPLPTTLGLPPPPKVNLVAVAAPSPQVNPPGTNYRIPPGGIITKDQTRLPVMPLTSDGVLATAAAVPSPADG